MDTFNYETLEGIIGDSVQVFDAESSNQLATLKIEKVYRSPANGEMFDAFAVDLCGEENEHLAQGTYLFKHSAFGEASLFITPNDIDKYQICISRKR